MLDFDLAEIYGYEVKRLNEQVSRNIARFPIDFMFQLTSEEADVLRSQIATSKKEKRGGRQYAPYAFTEQGIYMLATVLKGKLAEQQSIYIMRAFKEMKHYIHENMQFVTKNEIRALTDDINQKNEKRFIKIEKDIDKLNENFINDIDVKNFMIYKGEKVEADKAYIDIYKKANKTIYIIDDYVDIKTLNLLSHKKKNVEVILFTGNYGKNSPNRNKTFLTNSEVADFNKEYGALQVKENNECHDRFIIIDYKTKNEIVYHSGASSKDAGNKVCAINIFEKSSLMYPVIDKLLKNNIVKL